MGSLELTPACSHDGQASGRCRLDGARLVRELACDECGQLLAQVGSEAYLPAPELAPA